MHRRSQRDRLQTLYAQTIENRNVLVQKVRLLSPDDGTALEKVLLNREIEQNLAKITVAINECLSVADEINVRLLSEEIDIETLPTFDA
ncbi:hypothetical protein FB593_1289 [Rhizobium sp. SJZ105]|nr:hypothetical protein FB593_1289 [Rhizobium sp. SJZ105]